MVPVVVVFVVVFVVGVVAAIVVVVVFRFCPRCELDSFFCIHEWEHNRRLCRPRGPKDDANAKARETNAEEDVVVVVGEGGGVVFPERALNALTTRTHKGGLLDTKIHLDKSTTKCIFRTQKRQAFSKRTPHYTTKVKGEKSDEKEEDTKAQSRRNDGRRDDDDDDDALGGGAKSSRLNREDTASSSSSSSSFRDTKKI